MVRVRTPAPREGLGGELWPERDGGDLKLSCNECCGGTLSKGIWKIQLNQLCFSGSSLFKFEAL